ncbi:MAG TPA: hypothetical protein VEI81_07185 [Methanoregula sp.]|nr:hypothetical protein [Methanoregula sp.]
MNLPRVKSGAPLISLAFLAFILVLAAGCASSSRGEGPPGAPASPPETGLPAVTSPCGFASCHGLDLSCSTNPPQACPADYELGDKCRQYASCSSAGGTCQLLTTPQFDACKSCVERCGGADPAEILSCEEKC